MTRFRTRSLVAGAAAALLLSVGTPALAQPFPLNGNWTYQGRLTDAGVPANGIYDIQLLLCDRPGVGGALAASFHNNVVVTNGLFTIPDVATGFLGTFQGDRRWIEVQVRPGASVGAFTVLAPRQELTAAPYAIHASRATRVADHTLNDAYNSGGAGAGRVIQADSGEVAVQGSSGMRVELRLRVGDIDTEGSFELYTATANRTFELRDHANQGGSVQGYDENGGSRNYFIEPDIDGEGGFLFVGRGGFASGFIVDGNGGGTSGDPFVTISGDTRSMVFAPGAGSGNDSVVFPTDAISAPEILDEPGVSSSHRTGPTYPAGVITITEESSITVPVDGFLFVVASCELVMSHANGTNTSFTHGLNVDSSAGFAGPDQDFFVNLPAALPTASYTLTVGCNGVFPVSAGTHTVYYLGREDSGNVSFTNDVQLSVLFVPTAYGAVDPRGGRAAGGGDDSTPPRDRYTISEQDIAESQAYAEELSAARLARELAEVKAQLAELRRMMSDNKPSGK